MARTQEFIPGFIAEKAGEIRYYAVESNARAWNPAHLAPASIPVGAAMHDVFDSLEDFEAGIPAIAQTPVTLWSDRAQLLLTFASEDAAFSYSHERGDCLTDAGQAEVFCHRAGQAEVSCHHPEH